MFERDDSMSRAAAIVYERVRALPEFTAGREHVVATAIALCAGCDVAAMRELGGFSAVLERLIVSLPPAYHVNHGSKLIPMSVAGVLRTEVPSMRFAVQAALARRTV